ncbi:hypothetical protein CMI37_26385 [Candidatus Pacearchaeota archaeon]|nr:hypothetical protein [Candidatus Pacearchaeota archaeon]|tara:strand:- start:3310 stop:3567 length:258 start_codon:yes stop_codon:yes gene_type:complete
MAQPSTWENPPVRGIGIFLIIFGITLILLRNPIGKLYYRWSKHATTKPLLQKVEEQKFTTIGKTIAVFSGIACAVIGAALLIFGI